MSGSLVLGLGLCLLTSSTAWLDGRGYVLGGYSAQQLRTTADPSVCTPDAASFSYDPAAAAWIELPAAGQPGYRGSMSCGLVRAVGRYDMTVATAENLDGYTECAV